MVQNLKSMKPVYYTNATIKGTIKYGFDALAETLGTIQAKKVMDYGCGTGRSTKFIKELGAKVIGVDIRSDIIATAKKQYPEIEFRLIENAKIPFPNATFDLAISTFVQLEMASINEMELVAEEIFRILKIGGEFLILTVNPESWGNTYQSFSSDFPKEFARQSGQKINVNMITEMGEIKFQDYYWEIEDYLKPLKNAGFQIKEIQEITAEKDPPPFLIIKALKY